MDQVLAVCKKFIVKSFMCVKSIQQMEMYFGHLWIWRIKVYDTR